MKRILAIIGAVLLVFMYIMTLISALSGSQDYWNMLMASASCTIIVPVLLYAYGLIYRLLKERREELSANGEGGLLPDGVSSTEDAAKGRDDSEKQP